MDSPRICLGFVGGLAGIYLGFVGPHSFQFFPPHSFHCQFLTNVSHITTFFPLAFFPLLSTGLCGTQQIANKSPHKVPTLPNKSPTRFQQFQQMPASSAHIPTNPDKPWQAPNAQQGLTGMDGGRGGGASSKQATCKHNKLLY